ncbi:SDR family NAD(P)-dependent oxidoreductase [Bradyrhizobium cytisi]|uniref:SDR family NAD(P)-dependent oxidoreductase n=1 Tax=Bradyrhizobium cytisi TaxID=515489 RepID=A0A5S4VXT3_9BRAD|nr:SDR family NAD(P)-dependent oxidoreductase [Bradyrhizobium cytisi]
MSPEGKIAVVTGAGSGIGRASAVVLAKAGARILASDIDYESAEQAVSAIESIGVRHLRFTLTSRTRMTSCG